MATAKIVYCIVNQRISKTTYSSAQQCSVGVFFIQVCRWPSLTLFYWRL